MQRTFVAAGVLLVFAFAGSDVPTADPVTSPVAPINSVQSSFAITIPQLVSCQGKLTDTMGIPVPNGNYSTRFALYTQASGGSPYWQETQNVATEDGLFAVLLGSVTPVPYVPEAGDLYLGMKVGADPEMTPRIRIVSAAYAYLCRKADTADYVAGSRPIGTAGGDLNGTYPNPTVDGLQGRTVASTAPSANQVLKWTGSSWAPGNDSVGGGGGGGSVTSVGQGTGLTCTPNPITTTGSVAFDAAYGDGRYVNEGQVNSVTSAMISNGTVAAADLSQMGATMNQVLKWTGSTWTPRNDSIGSGGIPDSIPGSLAIAGELRVHTKARLGYSCYNSGAYAFCAGVGNSVDGDRASIAGGEDNSADGRYAHIGGGSENRAEAPWSTIGGGNVNEATDTAATVAGGRDNFATAQHSAVGGGGGNVASNEYAAVAGGRSNEASGYASAVGGGYDNTATIHYATIAGGRTNLADSFYAFVGGGEGNEAFGPHSAIGGGWANRTHGRGAVIGGGQRNWTSSPYATVAGGDSNLAGGPNSAIGGGRSNAANFDFGTIAGGYGNDVGSYATVGGGSGNQTYGYYAVVGGGYHNSADVNYAVVGGGRGNDAGMTYATIAGGYGNDAGGEATAIGGGHSNRASGWFATVAGGQLNRSTHYFSTVGGGVSNEASDSCATIAGGFDNAADGRFSTVAGGYSNEADSTGATVAGGYDNTARGPYVSIAGGHYNTATGDYASIAGGRLQSASGDYASVSGGYDNVASGEYATVGGGGDHIASGPSATIGGGWHNDATGRASTVPGGESNLARGAFSFAAGRYARARHAGSFVWSDSASPAAESVYTTGTDQFRVRARGGTWFFSNGTMTTGAYLAGGSNSWASACDSTTKEDFREVNRRELLEKVASLRVRDYKMKDQDNGTRHIGPVAQDFAAAFGYGETNTSINMADADGVLLAAVQALIEQNRQQQLEIESLRDKLEGR